MIELLDTDQWEGPRTLYSLRPLVHAIMGGGQDTVAGENTPPVASRASSTTAARPPMVGISDEVSARAAPLCAASLQQSVYLSDTRAAGPVTASSTRTRNTVLRPSVRGRPSGISRCG